MKWKLTESTLRPIGVVRCPKKGEWIRLHDGSIVQACGEFSFAQYEIYEPVEAPTKLGVCVVALLIIINAALWLNILMRFGGD